MHCGNHQYTVVVLTINWSKCQRFKGREMCLLHVARTGSIQLVDTKSFLLVIAIVFPNFCPFSLSLLTSHINHINTTASSPFVSLWHTHGWDSHMAAALHIGLQSHDSVQRLMMGWKLLSCGCFLSLFPAALSSTTIFSHMCCVGQQVVQSLKLKWHILTFFLNEWPLSGFIIILNHYSNLAPMNALI